MIKIKNLSFSNMFSFGKGNTICFESSVTQLDGKNGAGKSSIPTILEELYYNKNSRGLKKSTILNRNCGEKSYSAASSFEKDGDTYTISKTVTTTASVKLTKNGQDISGHTATQTYAELEKIIGLDFSTFSKLVYQSMVSSLDFLAATDANRKKFLVSLLGLEKYGEVQESIKEELSQHKSVLSGLESKTDYIVKLISEQVQTDKLPLVEVPEIDDSLLVDIASLESSKATIASDVARIQKNNLARNRLDAARLELNKLTCPSSSNTADYWKNKYNVQNAAIKLKTDELAKLLAAKTHCPSCGKAYDEDTSHRDAEKARIERELAELKLPMEEWKAEYAAAKSKEEYLAKQKEIDSLAATVDMELPTEIPDISTIESNIRSLTNTLNAQKAAKVAAETANQKALNHNAKVDAALQNLEKLKTDYAQALESRDSARIRNVRLQVLNDAFGTKGIVTYKIESMVKVFEGLINQYLEVLADGRFVLEFIVEDAKLALKLYDDSSEIEINQLSSGEFNRVNTATLLAVRKMMAAISKVNLNVLFLDEVVSVLDKEGKDTLIEVLLKEKDLNSVVVSHGYNHPLAAKIRVVKNNKMSELVHD